MVVVLDFKRHREVLHLDEVGVGVVVPTQEAILLSSEPPLLEWEVVDVLSFFVDLQVNVVTIEHVLPQHRALFFQNFHDFFFRLDPGSLGALVVNVVLLVRVNVTLVWAVAKERYQGLEASCLQLQVVAVVRVQQVKVA